MRKLLAIVFASMLLFSVSAASVSADSRCSGRPGAAIYEDKNFGGSSRLLCWPATGTGGIFYPNLGAAGWNDRISSISTFNFSGHTLRLYPDNNYADNSSGPDKVVTISGNALVSNLGIYWTSVWHDGFNDKASSLRTLN